MLRPLFAGKSKRKWLAAQVSSLSAVTLLSGVHGTELLAQGFPAKPVRYIMPRPAGSETDVFARAFARGGRGRIEAVCPSPFVQKA